MKNRTIILILLIARATLSPADGQVATGGPYSLEQSVTANGGSDSQANDRTLIGTVAQPVAGVNPSGGSYLIRSGFWQPSFAPTAATVSISGRITAEHGISKVYVFLTASTGDTRATLTSSLGYYRFDDVEVGQTYIISAEKKGYLFPASPRAVTVLDEMSDLDLKGERVY